MNTNLLRLVSIAAGTLVLSCGNDDNGSKAAQAGSCEGTYVACGGDVKGTWHLGKLCVTGSVTNALNALLAQYPSCSTAFTDGGLESNVSVTYEASNFTRIGTNHLTGKMKIDEACFADMTTGTPLSAQSCLAYAQVLPNIMTGRCVANNMACSVSVSCGYEGNTCNCSTDTTEQVDVSGTYSVAGNTLTEST